MPDSKQFGTPQHDGNQPGDATRCLQCEQMLADVLDGTLTPADQALFDAHMAVCALCSQMLADARRGAAWLEMLRDPRPEPPAQLLEKILAQTSGHLSAQTSPQPIAHQFPGAAILPAPVYTAPVYGIGMGKVLPFRARFTAAAISLSHIVRQPRIVMTAAMAFFSIALTLALTGVRLQDLNARNLAPSSLQRDFYSANTRVVQYYEGLRVVYELESRVHDLQSTDLQTTTDTDSSATTDTDSSAPTDTDSSAPTDPQTTAPDSAQPESRPADQTPADENPSTQPAPSSQKPAPTGVQPDTNQPQHKQPAPNPGTSRREDLNRTRRLVAVATHPARKERTLA